MRDFYNLKHGDMVRCSIDNDVLQVLVDRQGYIYLASERSYWPASEFDPRDW